ncbi:MAG: M3 family metallopeptidase [Aestuariivita sp.]|nr:M3 family metallopeptidase [Aestuariivita sp.]
MSNPLLTDWTTPFESPPFDEISDEHFSPAFHQSLKRHQVEIDAIANNEEAPSFENTIEALESIGVDLDRVLSVFFSVSSADSNERREALQREFSPLLAKHSADIFSNKKLFERIEVVWRERETVELSNEQRRILMLHHRNFIRAGARLLGKDSQRLKEIKMRLAALGTEFAQNLLADERDWYMELSEEDLIDLPEFMVESARTAGHLKGLNYPVITASRSSIVPFLQYSSRRDLREVAYRAWVSRGANKGKTDNRPIVTEILSLREEQAQLLGYENFSAFKLETEMAQNPSIVRDLLLRVWKPAKTQALEDSKHLLELMQNDGFNCSLEPWDWRYYSEKRRKILHDIDEAELKPFFEINQIIQAAFYCANRLFSIKFEPVSISLYHPDCQAWNVTRNNKHIALFIGDYFARDSKRSGAWCSAMRSQAQFPKHQTPIVINVCNFAKGNPTLLSSDDARTLFHEFGHALHQILSNVTYESISGTSVARDFVELPSQLFEHWLMLPEVLNKFARHVETGQSMPQETVDRLLSAAKYDMGFQTVEYLASAFVDLNFHNGCAPRNPIQAEADTLKEIGMPHEIGMRHATSHFAHVFAGDGYSSGYYSYLWSEVMDADAFEMFEQSGDPFNTEHAKSLERHILSAGGSKEASELYRAFRGSLPEPDALLRGRGLLDVI